MKNDKHNKLFPVLKEGYALQRGPTRGIVYPSSLRSGKLYYEVNQSAARILEHCNGKTELEEIANIISLYYNEKYQPTLNVIKTYLDENIDTLIDIYHQPVERTVYITGNWEVTAPSQVSIELTYNCNFFCKHCYIDSGPEREEFWDSKKLIQVLDGLADNGIFMVEITGGEPLLHPDFLSIVEHCAELFPLVSIITNGYTLSKKHIARLRKYRSQLSFQINLNGDNSEYVDWFCNKKSAFVHAQNAIKLLVKEGFTVRAAMILTPKNIEQVFNTANIAKKLGVKSFMISPIIPVGRGQFSELSYDLVFTTQNIPQLTDLVKKLEKNFGDFIFKSPESPLLMSEETDEKDIGCGAGNFGLSITPMGDLKLCPMANSNDFPIGNVYDDDLHKLFSKLPISLKEPDPDTCGDCKHILICGKCVARGLRKYHEMGDKCSWGKITNIASILEEAKD